MWEGIRKWGKEIELGKIPNSCNSKQIAACGHFLQTCKRLSNEDAEIVAGNSRERET